MTIKLLPIQERCHNRKNTGNTRGNKNSNGIHSKFKNVRKSVNVRSYHSNQVAWQWSRGTKCETRDESGIFGCGVYKFIVFFLRRMDEV